MIRLLLSALIIMMCGCSSDDNDVSLIIHQSDGHYTADVTFSAKCLGAYNESRIEQYMHSSSLFTVRLVLSHGRESHSYLRECRYDRWNDRYIISDDYRDDEQQFFHSIEDMTEHLLMMTGIPIEWDVRSGDDVRIDWTLEMMQFPPPFNLILSDRYKVRVRRVLMVTL